MPLPSATPLKPGLLVLHGNRLELLADAVLAWLAANPLQPLEEETLLVQSNGMAEWLKMEIATAHGVCAATRVELPARFIWRAYRAVLGRSAVPALSPLDKLPLTWRLMGLLPRLLDAPGFAPIAGFLGGGDADAPTPASGDAARRLQLAQRLADLYDQYQVYRSDWLQDWAAGNDRLRSAAGGPGAAVPADQQWQPALWRAALAALSPDDQQATRPLLHQRFLQALQAPGATRAGWPALPRRIVLFGTTHIPHQTLAAVAALAAHCQVLLAVPNPSRYHWADTVAGRELLQAPRQRHGARGGRDLASVPLQDMHAHGHPLLSAWGRQARDFVRQLDAFDDVQQAQQHFEVPRVDLFDDGPCNTLLGQVQAHIRDLLPLPEHPQVRLAADDRSIVFHAAHSAQREVEILHDQLLHLLAHPPVPPGGKPLQPRDIVVMVPAIDSFAPAIRSVFGQHARGHARHIPWGITDQQDRGHHPLLVALEWLLRAPQQRFALSELRALLDVPALLQRFELDPADLSTLVAWMQGAGARWGLHATQRNTLGLQACGDTNSWHFALQRMVLGYAAGDVEGGFAGIEPHAEVAGLAAGLAGALAELLDVIGTWWDGCSTPRTPQRWGTDLRALLQQLFSATDDHERALLAALDDALTAWLQACEAAEFDDAVELAVVRESWLDAVDEPGVSRRFKAGGVTFCTLLPMRAIPFGVVCLLGMNDGDYPRRSTRSDFDLMGLPGQSRPGDRSRRDDDRQLMLDALLSARQVLYISWAGRSQRDNQTQAPSVLVAQLRDYLAAGWGEAAVQERTVDHPLQPFSRDYFCAPADGSSGAGLFTYASEWRLAHAAAAGGANAHADTTTAIASLANGAAAPLATTTPLDVRRLAAFLRNPVKEFFRQRLQVSFGDIAAADADDESFASTGLDRWHLLDAALAGVRLQLESGGSNTGATGVGAASLPALIESQVNKLQRAGRLPLAGPGDLVHAALVQTLLPMLTHWQAVQAQLPQQRDKLALRVASAWPQLGGPDAADANAPGDTAPLAFDDWLVGLRAADEFAPPQWTDLQAGHIANKKCSAARPEKLLTAWLRCLVSAACGQPAGGVVIGADAVANVSPPAADAALGTLQSLLQACSAGLCGDTPLPTTLRTGLAYLTTPGKARDVFDGSDAPGAAKGMAEGSEPCLARLFPDYAALAATPGFDAATRLLYTDYADWLAQHVELAKLPDAAALLTDKNGNDDGAADA